MTDPLRSAEASLGRSGDEKKEPENKAQVWVDRVKAIETRACSCTGDQCFKQFMADLKKLKDDSQNESIPREYAEKVRAHTEKAMKCALKTIKK